VDLGIRGRTALVTGASAGLGLASAVALAKDGARLAIVSRSETNLEQAREAIRSETGQDAALFTADVSDLDTIEPLVRAVTKALGTVSILVANAGGPPAGTFEELPRDKFDLAYRLTLMSNVELCREVLPGMVRQKWGRIVAITSTSVKQPIDGLLLSNTFRTGLTGFLKTISREYAPHGITVNSVAPGYTDTERLVELAQHAATRQQKSIEEIRAGWAAGTPMKRLGRSKEVGATVAWLCSEAAAFITGSVIPVDGGRAAGLL
jgi:3-oxoacyl-[acyl-carrier protein] reductase